MTVGAVPGRRTPRGRAPRDPSTRARPPAWRIAAAGLAACALACAPVIAAAPPAYADRPVAQATGNAMSISLAGKAVGVGEYKSKHDGTKEQTSGSNRPPSPIGGGQDSIVAGMLAQDARSWADGQSVGCAGLVGADGVLQIGDDKSCLNDKQGKIRLSLGSLGDLAPADLPLPDLPELPELPALPELPPLDPNGLPKALELRLDAEALAAECTADADSASGNARLSDVQLTVVAGGQEIPLLTLETGNQPNANAAVSLADLLNALASNLPGFDDVLDQIISQVPDGELPSDQLLKVVSNEQVKDGEDTISVTALRLAVVPNNLVDARIGQATCGPNQPVSANRPKPTPSPTAGPAPKPEPEPEEQPVPTSVPAGLASGPGDGDDDGGAAGGIGLGAVLVLAAGGATLGGYLHRRRRT